MIVVDTNVIAYLWLPDTLTVASVQLMHHDAAWAAPLLWRSEFRNLLVGAVRGRAISADQAVDLAGKAEAYMTGREYEVNSRQVLALAARSGCSAYDCEFVALAASLGATLVTNDRAVLRAFPDIATPLAAFSSGA